MQEMLDTYHLQTQIEIIPCNEVTNVTALVTDGAIEGVPAGSYIIYKDYWVNLVVGSDRQLAFALFAHELAHIINDDAQRAAGGVPLQTIELEADEFAACMLARANGAWATMEELLDKIRHHEHQLYPPKLETLAKASKAFENCRQTRTDTRLGFHLGNIVVPIIKIYPEDAVSDPELVNERIRTVLTRAIRSLQSSLTTQHQQQAIGVVTETVNVDLNDPRAVLDVGVAMGALALAISEGDMEDGNLTMTSDFVPVRPSPIDGRPYFVPTIVDTVRIGQDVSAARMSSQINPQWAHRAILSLAVEELYNARNGDPDAVGRSEQLLLALLKTLRDDDAVLDEVKDLLTHIGALRANMP